MSEVGWLVVDEITSVWSVVGAWRAKSEDEAAG